MPAYFVHTRAKGEVDTCVYMRKLVCSEFDFDHLAKKYNRVRELPTLPNYHMLPFSFLIR